MVFGYQDARDFFGAVREAALEVERYENQIKRMERAEGVRAQGYQATSRGGYSRGMRATDARIDFEERMRRRMDSNYNLIDLACRVCYGEDNKGGVYALAGPRCADALWWRFCCGYSWQRTAGMLDASVKSVQRWCDTALDCVDGMGVRPMLAGAGIAEG